MTENYYTFIKMSKFEFLIFFSQLLLKQKTVNCMIIYLMHNATSISETLASLLNLDLLTEY